MLDPNDPVFRPMIFEGDYAAIGQKVAETPGLAPFEFDPNQYDPALVGEERFVVERERMQRLAQERQSGQLADPYAYGGPCPPGMQARELERDAEFRALQGGLPDDPGTAPVAVRGGSPMRVRG